MPIIIGDTIFLSNNLNLNHNLFKGLSILEFITLSIKKPKEINSDPIS